MKIALVLLTILFLHGCAIYDFSRCEDGVCSELHVMSPRKFKTIDIKYDGEAKAFGVTAGDVGTDVSALNALLSIVLMQQQALQERQQ